MPRSPTSGSVTSEAHKVRYDLPATELRPYVSGYCTISMVDYQDHVEWLLPGPATIVLRVGAGPVDVLTLFAKYPSIASASIFAPTTRATRWVFRGGKIILVELTPLGWLQLSETRVRPPSDTIHSLNIAGCRLQTLIDEDGFEKASIDAAVLSNLDVAVASLLARSIVNPCRLQLMTNALYSGEGSDINGLADQLGLTLPKLRQETLGAFGMSPKLVYRLVRLLRAFDAYCGVDNYQDWDVAKHGYYDGSHFTRDANDFLGSTPRRLLSGDSELLCERMRVRTNATGFSSAMLDTSWLQSSSGVVSAR